jgi:transposase
MRYIQLTSAQRSMLARIRRESIKSQVRDRAFCILLSDQSQSIPTLSQAFDVYHNTIRNWFNAFENDSLVGLYDEPGRGSKSKLQPQHKSSVIAFVEARPQDLDYAVYKIAEHFGLRVSRWTVQRFLKSQGYTWRRVRRGMPKEEADVVEKKQKS